MMAPRREGAWWRRPFWTFTRHYVEMIVAMLVGMALFYPLWVRATEGAAASSWVHRTDVESLVMATAMTLPMVAWMRIHGCRPRLLVEMSVAMYAGFVVLFPLLWAGVLGEMGLMMAGHVLMPLFMLGAMLLRREEYARGHTAHHRP
ncbi:hypothetical protein [Mumia sp. DW29H23]|uniref:hypothetical protein n=1 Tax=Mumia sp. DW29H23 TaxID=3421241 RepID=UPI003D6864C2